MRRDDGHILELFVVILPLRSQMSIARFFRQCAYHTTEMPQAFSLSIVEECENNSANEKDDSDDRRRRQAGRRSLH
jgi:hypothetical protein